MKPAAKNFGKSIIRSGLAMYSAGAETLPVLMGPLRGRKLLRKYGLRFLSTVFGVYEKSVAHCFLERAGNSAVIYDIGANYGYFSLLAATNPGACVYAFEPIPEIARDFDRLISLNNLERRVTLIESALSSQEGEVLMVTPGSDATGLMETALRGQPVEREKGVKVAMTTLDNFVMKQGHPAPALVKIDVEGAEAMVLEGAGRVIDSAHPDLLIEVHGAEPANAVWDYLDSAGYIINVIGENESQTVSNKADWMRRFENDRWYIVHIIAFYNKEYSVA